MERQKKLDALDGQTSIFIRTLKLVVSSAIDNRDVVPQAEIKIIKMAPITPFNPRPDTVFRHLRPDRAKVAKHRRLVAKVAEYSRLMVLFLVLGQYLTKLWQVKGQIFANSMIFQLHESIASNLYFVAA